MGPSAAAALTGELRPLLRKTIALVGEVTGADAAWSTPFSHSQAGMELAMQEALRPEPQTGSWPWLAAPVFGRLALHCAGDEATAFLENLRQDKTACAADVLCRAILESTSLTWWLLDPDIGAERRLARSLLCRLNAAREVTRAVDYLGLGPDEDRSDYGETPEDIRQEIRDLGPAWRWNDSGTRVSWGEEEQAWPSYTNRVEDLVRPVWPQSKLPYAVLSAVTHAGLPGLARNFSARLTRTGESAAQLSADRESARVWLWCDTYLVLGALVLTAHRAATFLSLEDQIAALRNWIAELDRTLPQIRPGVVPPV